MKRGRPKKPAGDATSGSRRKGKNRDAVSALAAEIAADNSPPSQENPAKPARAAKSRGNAGAKPTVSVSPLVRLLTRQITIPTKDKDGKIVRRALLSREVTRQLQVAASQPVTVDDLRTLIAAEVAIAQALFEAGELAAKDFAIVLHRVSSQATAMLQLQDSATGQGRALVTVTFGAAARTVIGDPDREQVERPPPNELGDVLEVGGG